MHRLKTLLLILLIIIVLLPLVALGGAYFGFVRPGLPQLDGELALPGLTAPVTVYRDPHGIPYIYAANPHDLFFAQGFVTAQDRFWQMESSRRAAHGQLSEIIGEPGLKNDRFMRTLGMTQAAQADWDILDVDTQGLIRAYADGVNAFISSAGSDLPLEFKILGFEPEPWTPLDTLVFGKLMAWSLSNNYEHELIIAQLAGETSWENVLSILPSFTGPYIIPDANTTAELRETATALLAVSQAVRSLVPLAKPDQGSNNWVVNGEHTASSSPMLANDPHQTLTMPSLWYEVGLFSADGVYEVTGGSLPGIPGIEIGHNQRIAWGVTNARPDVQDLFIETLNDTGNQYQFMDEWIDLTKRIETIQVKDSEPMIFTVRSTHHGPLISDVLEDADQDLTLSWTGLDGHRLAQAIFKLNRAQNWEEFRAALEDWEVPSMHFVYADVDGHIGYQLPGSIPVRTSNETFSLLPVPGSDGEHEWVDFISFQELPHDLDPAAGFYATANNKPFDETYPYFISHYWQPPYRVDHISKTIRSATGLVPTDFEDLQSSVYSDINLSLALTLGAEVLTSDPVEGAVLQLLIGWDGEMRADSAPAAISEAAIFHLIRETLSATFDDKNIANYINLPAYPYFYVQALLDDPENPWWGDQRQAVLNAVLTASVNELKDISGDDPAEWTWGQIHTMTFAHPMGSIGPLSLIFNRGPFPIGGNWNTVNSGAYFPDEPYQMALGPAYRFVVDLADWDNARSVITTGQSGQPFSPHYDDNIDDWRSVDYHALPFSQTAVQENAAHTLTLLPGAP